MGTAQIIDGTKIAEKIKQELKLEISDLIKETKITPALSAIQVGDNPASRVYIKNQKASAEELGINYNLVQLPADVSDADVLSAIERQNLDTTINGIILQMPLPAGINSRKIQMAIAPDKDVEGITPPNLGMLLYTGVSPAVAPCTALSVIECLKSTGIPLKGKNCVVVGHSEIVGKPVMLMLLSSLLESATPTVCHIATVDLSGHTSRADIIIVAVGKPGLIKADMVKEGAVVIDVGINRVTAKDAAGNPVIDEKTGKPKMKTVGDVDAESVSKKAGFITPVPGGVGAVTTVLLFKNLLHLWKNAQGKEGNVHKLL